ncbi:MAG: hypothetical protein MUF29_04315 [Chitinophagaceae bacterium]|jgi:hypothetical protein|nr:hypothetical protein [Chitinophagaceae bacterium]
MKRIHYLIYWSILLPVVATSQVVSFPDTSTRESFFPLMHRFKKKAEAAGAAFPKPYGLAGSMYQQRQYMEITKIRLGNVEISEDGGIIDFDDSNIRNTVVSSQLRADFWLLPFVNVYGMVGRVNTFNDITLKINLNPPPGSPNPNDIELMRENTIANINGTVAGIGTVLAGGYGRVFANVNLTWAKTWLSEVNSTQTSFVAFPMAGLTTKFANLFVGGIYQNTGQVNKGQFPGSGGQTVTYELQFAARRWNYAVGFNKSIGNWNMVLIQGFGARVNSVVEIGYRFGH